MKFTLAKVLARSSSVFNSLPVSGDLSSADNLANSLDPDWA